MLSGQHSVYRTEGAPKYLLGPWGEASTKMAPVLIDSGSFELAASKNQVIKEEGSNFAFLLKRWLETCSAAGTMAGKAEASSCTCIDAL